MKPPILRSNTGLPQATGRRRPWPQEWLLRIRYLWPDWQLTQLTTIECCPRTQPAIRPFPETTYSQPQRHQTLPLQLLAALRLQASLPQAQSFHGLLTKLRILRFNMEPQPAMDRRQLSPRECSQPI